MQRLKEFVPSTSASRRPYCKQQKSATPYDQIPIALRSHHMRPFSQILHNSEYCLARKEKVRDITLHTLQRDFKNKHNIQQSRENQLRKSFKVRCKRKQEGSKAPNNQQFFMEMLQGRQEEVKRLHCEYLAMVREEAKNCKEDSDLEARICEYNIVYEYRGEHLPSPFHCIRK